MPQHPTGVFVEYPNSRPSKGCPQFYPSFSSMPSKDNYVGYRRLGNPDETLYPGFNFQKTLLSDEVLAAVPTPDPHFAFFDSAGHNNQAVKPGAWQFPGCSDLDLMENCASSTATADLDNCVNTPTSLSPSWNSSLVAGSDLQPSLRPGLDMATLALESSWPMQDMDNDSDLSTYSPVKVSHSQPTKASVVATVNPEPSILHTCQNDKSRKPVARSGRSVWCEKNDLALLKTMLCHQDLLLSAYRRRPRSRYWACISENLASEYGMHRNKRQCRDRFNLIYWKAVRDQQQERHTATTSEHETLKQECMRRFYIDKDNNLMLRPTARTSDAPAEEANLNASAQVKTNPNAETKPSVTAFNCQESPLQIFVRLQKDVAQLTKKLDPLHQELDSQRELLAQLEQKHTLSLRTHHACEHAHTHSARQEYDRYTGDQGAGAHKNIKW
ncbi:LAME_0F00936g1_1 [Lachancea meyersii CBS 8951]|uniref:LAME_0F00936g1_1 n=1 Tax=Lachancea meyersii CBS 8951 TaxID=1266667 RepID=A0A1G4JPY3_9SACH|nr:LAME_0F00936g1_1 [Lachancea meyersii CBS 8951]